MDLSKLVKSGREIKKVTTLIARVNTLISHSWDLGIRSKMAAPTTGRNIRVLNIGNPKLFVIACSIYVYLNSIQATIISTPVAIIVA